jgi:hypothetical protein
MNRFDGYDSDAESEEFYFSLVPDEERRRYAIERGWSHQSDDRFMDGSVLFADRGAELELRREMRLSELWARCQSGFFTLEEFRELSGLIAEVDGLRGSLCIDCAMLDRPNVSANWALANTSLCRGHLRFRLAHAQIDGGGTYHPA